MSNTVQSDDRVFLLNVIELGVALFRGPNPDGWSSIVGLGLPELLARAPENLPHLTASVAKLQDSLPNSSGIADAVSDLEVEYVRLFISAGGGVAVPLYESCHQDAKPQVMGDSALAMRDRLEKVGLAISLDSNEPPDHLTLELEYLYHLLVIGWADDQPDLVTEGVAFAGEVMLPWVRRFQHALAESSPHPVFLSGGEMVVAVLEATAEI